MASLDAIRRVRIETTETGADAAAAKLNKLADAQQGVAVASDRTTKSSLSVEAAYTRLQRTYDSAFRQQQQLEKVERTLNAAREQGLVSEERRAELMALAAVQIGKVGTANDNLAKSHAGLSGQAQAAGHSMRSFVDSVIAGQSPTTALAQQIGHLQYAASGPGGLKEAFGGVASTLNSLLTPGRVVGAVLVGAAVGAAIAWNRYDEQQRQVGATLEGVGRIVGGTADQFRAMATRISEAGRTTVTEALATSNALARTGELNAKNIETFGVLQKQIAATFTDGDLAKARDMMVKLAEDPQKGFEQLNRQLRFLDIAEQQHIRTLFEQGRAQEAIAAILARLPGALSNYERSISAFSYGWEVLARNIDRAASALGGYIDRAARATPGGGQQAPTLNPDNPSLVPDPVKVEQSAKAVRNLFDEVFKLDEEQRKASGDAFLTGVRARVDYFRDQLKSFEGPAEEAQKMKRFVEDLDKTLSANPAIADRILKMDNYAEAVSIARQAVKTLFDEDGRYITQAENLSKIDDLRNQRTLAVTNSEKARLDVLIKEREQYGQRISGEQAEAEKRQARIAIMTEEQRAFQDLDRTQKDQAQTLEVERSLLFASAAERAGVIAALRTEQELRRQGINTLGEEAQKRIAVAAAQARQASADQQLRRSFQDIQNIATNALSGFINDLAQGVRLAEALKNVMQQAGRGLVNAGIQTIATSGGNPVQAGIGAAEVGTGVALQLLGAGPSKASQRRKQAADAALQQQHDEAERRQQALVDAAGRATQFRDAAFLLGQDQNTRTGATAALRLRQMRELDDEFMAGNQALQALQQKHNEEMLKLNEAFDAKDLERERQVREKRLSLQDRLFAALNNESTLEGQLAAFDRQATREREETARDFADLLPDLEAAQFAERQNIIRDFSQKAIDEERRTAQERLDAINVAAKNIVNYVNSLLSGSESTLSPAGRLSAAQAAYNSQIGLAQAGNIDAQGTITQFADTLLKASRDFYASGAGYQAIFSQVTGDLLNLPAVEQATDPVVAALRDVLLAIQATTGAVNDNRVQTVAALAPIQTSTAGTKDAADATKAAIDQANSLQVSANALQQSANAILQTQANLLVQMANLNLTSTNLLVAVANQTAYLINIARNLQIIAGNTFDTSNNLTLGFTNGNRAGSSAPNTGPPALLAQGGWVNGPGTALSDSISARLSNGEFVVNARSAALYGPMLEAINDNRPPPIAAAPGNSNGALIAEVRALRAEIADLKAVAAGGAGATVAVLKQRLEHDSDWRAEDRRERKRVAGAAGRG